MTKRLYFSRFNDFHRLVDACTGNRAVSKHGTVFATIFSTSSSVVLTARCARRKTTSSNSKKSFQEVELKPNERTEPVEALEECIV